MAIFYLRVRTFGRSRGKSGSSATSAAAYRSGERIRDERTARVYDHRRRADVIHKEVVLPGQLAAQGDAMAWARNRAALWNAAEHAELRRNARVAREFVVALPHELAPEKRAQLTMQFAQTIADRYHSAVDVAIHAPRGDARNYHAHLLATTREVTPDGLGRKTTLELSGTRRHELGLPRWREEIGSLRERWADLTNAALEHAHIPTRVTHLSRAERGLTPSDVPPRVPLAAYYMERRGERSFIAEKIRERYRVEIARARTTDGSRAPEPSRSEARRQQMASNAKALAATGLSMFRDIGMSVRLAWRGLQERIGEELPGAGPGPPVSARIAASSSDHGRAGPTNLKDAAELGNETNNPLSQLDREALRSAQKWLASRQMGRARDVSSLEHSVNASANESARASAHEHEHEHEHALESRAGTHRHELGL